MERLQGVAFHSRKEQLIPIAYSRTKAGNICVYYEGGFYHYLNDHEKESFNSDGLKEHLKK